MQIKSQMTVTVHLAGTPLSGATVLRMLSPFTEAKKCFDGQLGIPAAKMPFSVFTNLLIEEGYVKKRKDTNTDELWYVLVNPESLFDTIKDIQERLKAAECLEESKQEVPMGKVTLQVKTRTRPHTTISDGNVTVSYGDLQKVFALCKKEQVIPNGLVALYGNCFQLLTDMGMVTHDQQNDTSEYGYRVSDLEQIQVMEQTLKWMELPSQS